MAIVNATINMRNGQYADMDPAKQVTAEIAVVTSGDPSSSDGKGVYATFAPGNVKRLCTYQEVSGLVDLAQGYAESAEDSAEIAETQATSAGNSATSASESAAEAEGYKEFVENAVNLNIPEFSVDFATGLLMYEGGMFDFLVNYETGNLDWEVG